MEIGGQYDLIGALVSLLSFLMGGADTEGIRTTLASVWRGYSILAYIVSAMLLWGTIYAMIRYDQLSEEEQQLLREAEHAYAHAKGTTSKSTKWTEVQKHVSSDNPNDWRLAVIEADIMLEEALNNAGYVGTSIGDKLKTVNPQNLRSIQDAWQAHKVRNEIAHRGSDFVLTKKIAAETINRFERVFEELGTI